MLDATKRFLESAAVAWDSATPYTATAEAGRLAEPDRAALANLCAETGDDADAAEAEVVAACREHVGWKSYTYRTDAEQGEVEAASLQDAMEAARREARVTDDTIADGAFCWVEDPDTGERLQVGTVD